MFIGQDLESYSDLYFKSNKLFLYLFLYIPKIFPVIQFL